MTMVTDVNKHPFVVLLRAGCLRFVGVGQLAPGDRQVFLLAVSTGSLAVRRIWARCVLRPVDLETCVTPRSGSPPAERGGHGPFTRLRCPGCCEGSPAVSNPKGNLIFTRFPAAARGSVLGLLTAQSRAPRQRSRPTREASLGLGLPSALPWGRSVGRPSPRLGTRVLGSFTSTRSIHVNRTDRRSAGADPLA